MNLLIFGLGYSASHFAHRRGARFATVAGTFRSAGPEAGVPPLPEVARLHFDGSAPTPELESALARASHVLVSIPPDEAEDVVLARFGASLRQAKALKWIGYLSTVGVYGNADGAWIDETAPLRPTSERNAVRVDIEKAWTALAQEIAVPVQIFRLAGIYGPGRNAIVNLARGTARRVIKPGQVFNRIHVEDIAGALMAGIDRPEVGPFINVTDNEPAPPQDVVVHAATLAGIEPPAEVPYDAAKMTPMARSFYGENKRVSNRLLREELGYALKYPSYREGLAACAAVDGGKALQER